MGVYVLHKMQDIRIFQLVALNIAMDLKVGTLLSNNSTFHKHFIKLDYFSFLYTE